MEYVETDPTGRYGRFEHVLGRGAMKTVYKAIDEVLGMEVAWNQIKLNQVLRSSHDLERLYSEVHLLSTLNHHSIIKFYTSWIDHNIKTFNFITEMFTSGTLRAYREKYKRVDIRAIKNWARQILQGLIYLHSHDPPVIHRDLKCDNIFVNGHLGEVKIGDLGLAAILQGGSQSAHSVIGTPEFMAPELYEEHYNELVDVYSFGMCVLEMLTSEYPYSECANPAQIYKKVTSGKLPRAFYRVQDFEAQRFIGKCLVNASKRKSAKELLLDPFLALGEAEAKVGSHKPFLNDNEMEKLRLSEDEDNHGKKTEMIIKGKLNPEDGTVFLKVQIADKDGSSRNVYFPFDVLNDTALEVAVEMVKELEISDWEPFEIAEMIDGEISAIMPRPPHKKKLAYPEAYYYAAAFSNRGDDDDDSSSSISSQSSCSNNLVRSPDPRVLSRNRSLVDVRSQLLHRSLVEEVHKRRLFKTVGDVESIGFQAPDNSEDVKKKGRAQKRLVESNSKTNKH